MDLENPFQLYIYIYTFNYIHFKDDNFIEEFSFTNSTSI